MQDFFCLFVFVFSSQTHDCYHTIEEYYQRDNEYWGGSQQSLSEQVDHPFPVLYFHCCIGHIVSPYLYRRQNCVAVKSIGCNQSDPMPQFVLDSSGAQLLYQYNYCHHRYYSVKSSSWTTNQMVTLAISDWLKPLTHPSSVTFTNYRNSLNQLSAAE